MKSSIAYLVAPFIGWLVAQIIKNILGVTGLHGKIEKYLTSGGMPSAHSATVFALVAVMFMHEGLSELFAVTACFTAIIIYDALVARRSIGEQGTALTNILKKNNYKEKLPRVALGHKPLEVVAGSVIGIIVGIIVAFFITN